MTTVCPTEALYPACIEPGAGVEVYASTAPSLELHPDPEVRASCGGRGCTTAPVVLAHTGAQTDALAGLGLALALLGAGALRWARRLA